MNGRVIQLITIKAFMKWSNFRLKLQTMILGMTLLSVQFIGDSFCGLVVRVPGYRSRCPGPIPGITRFSEK
jgi:hypothetical protein